MFASGSSFALPLVRRLRQNVAVLRPNYPSTNQQKMCSIGSPFFFAIAARPFSTPFYGFLWFSDVDIMPFVSDNKLRLDYTHRGRKYKLFLPGCRSNTRHNFFTYRTGRIWNNLPAEIL